MINTPHPISSLVQFHPTHDKTPPLTSLQSQCPYYLPSHEYYALLVVEYPNLQLKCPIEPKCAVLPWILLSYFASSHSLAKAIHVSYITVASPMLMVMKLPYFDLQHNSLSLHDSPYNGVVTHIYQRTQDCMHEPHPRCDSFSSSLT